MPFLSHPATLLCVKLRIQSTRSLTVKLKQLKIAGRCQKLIGQICTIVLTFDDSKYARAPSSRRRDHSELASYPKFTMDPDCFSDLDLLTTDTAHTYTSMHFLKPDVHWINPQTAKHFPLQVQSLWILWDKKTNCSTFIYICLEIYSIIK